MSTNTLEDSIKQAIDSSRSQALNQSQLQNLVLDIQKELNSYKDQMANRKSEYLKQAQGISKELTAIANNLATNVKDLEDIPGVRTPKFYEVPIEFDFQDTSLKFNSAEINPEGPFLITQITPLWQMKDPTKEHYANIDVAIPGLNNTPNGRILPCTAYPMIINSFGTTNAEYIGYTTPNYIQLFNRYQNTGFPYLLNQQWGVLSDIPEFDFQIEIAGSGKYFTNQPISAACLYGYMGLPLFMGVQGWAERGDKIVINATPTVPVPQKGVVRFILQGYQILGNVNISDALGYGK
jgi:hypothetical protein